MFTFILIIFSILLIINILDRWLEAKADKAEREAEEFFKTTMIQTQAKLDLLEQLGFSSAETVVEKIKKIRENKN